MFSLIYGVTLLHLSASAGYGLPPSAKTSLGLIGIVTRFMQVDEFIKNKNKVRLAVRFRGREAAHIRNTGKVLLDKFLSMLTTPYNVDSEMAIEGGSIAITIAP